MSAVLFTIYLFFDNIVWPAVSGGWVWGRPRLGWMDGVKVAFGNRGMTAEAERNIRKSGEPWYICNWMSFTWPFLLGPVFFLTALPCSGGYHLERGGMPLHDVVGINSKKAQLLKIKAQMSSICGKGCILMIVCMLSDLTWLPLLGGRRKLWYIIISIYSLCVFLFWLLFYFTISVLFGKYWRWQLLHEFRCYVQPSPVICGITNCNIYSWYSKYPIIVISIIMKSDLFQFMICDYNPNCICECVWL